MQSAATQADLEVGHLPVEREAHRMPHSDDGATTRGAHRPEDHPHAMKPDQLAWSRASLRRPPQKPLLNCEKEPLEFGRRFLPRRRRITDSEG